MQFSSRFRRFVSYLLKNLLRSCFILPGPMRIALHSQNPPKPHQGIGFTIPVPVLPASVQGFLVHLARFEKPPLCQERIAQTELRKCNSVVVANFLIHLQSFLRLLQGASNVPYEKGNLTQVMKFTRDAVLIPYVLMDRQRFLIPLAR